MSATAFPLCWPLGWARDTSRWHPRHPFAEAVARRNKMLAELGREIPQVPQC